MAYQHSRSSPDGRPISIRREIRAIPQWVARRRRAYKLVDVVADHAKRAVKRWLIPRPSRHPGRTLQRMQPQTRTFKE